MTAGIEAFRWFASRNAVIGGDERQRNKVSYFGHVPCSLSTETLPDCCRVFTHGFVGEADEDRNSDDQ
jgi:hypothetical protein